MAQAHFKMYTRLAVTVAGATMLLFSGIASAELSKAEAMKILKKNDCTKCHAIDKTKKGPSYEKIAAKYKGKPDGVEKLVHNLTDAPMVKLEDGTEEKHKVLKVDDPQKKADLIDWILAQ